MESILTNLIFMLILSKIGLSANSENSPAAKQEKTSQLLPQLIISRLGATLHIDLPQPQHFKNNISYTITEPNGEDTKFQAFGDCRYELEIEEGLIVVKENSEIYVRSFKNDIEQSEDRTSQKNKQKLYIKSKEINKDFKESLERNKKRKENVVSDSSSTDNQGLRQSSELTEELIDNIDKNNFVSLKHNIKRLNHDENNKVLTNLRGRENEFHESSLNILKTNEVNDTERLHNKIHKRKDLVKLITKLIDSGNYTIKDVNKVLRKNILINKRHGEVDAFDFNKVYEIVNNDKRSGQNPLFLNNQDKILQVLKTQKAEAKYIGPNKVDIFEQNETTSCRIKEFKLGPLKSEHRGNWIFSSNYVDKDGVFNEIYQLVTIDITERIQIIPKTVNLREGETMKIRLEHPIQDLESCELIHPFSAHDRSFDRDLQYLDACGYVVKNISSTDAGVWRIVAVGQIAYKGVTYLNVA